MSRLLKKNIYFLHIPKTGGNFIKYIIDKSVYSKHANIVNKHANYDFLVGLKTNPLNPLNFLIKPIKIPYNISSLLKRLNFKQKNFKSFCVVRHPLTWYESYFKYLHKVRWQKAGDNGCFNFRNWHCLSPLNMPRTDNFDEFMKYINKNTPGFLTYLFHSFVLPSNARVLKFENLKNDLINLNNEWNMGLDISLINENKKINVSEQIDIIWMKETLQTTLKNESGLLSKYNYNKITDTSIKVKH